MIPRYGKDLDNKLKNVNYKISPTSVYNLGVHLLDILETIHESGLIYNDLKLDNILLDMGEHIPYDLKIWDNCFENLHLNLIDFGLASNWKC